PSPVTITRLIGAVLALVAVGWAVSPHLGGGDIALWMLLLPFFAWLGIGAQQAMNGQLKLVAASALPPTFLNFVVGLLGLMVADGTDVSLSGRPRTFPTNPLLSTAVLIGAVCAAGTAMVVRTSALLLLCLASTSGQFIM